MPRKPRAKMPRVPGTYTAFFLGIIDRLSQPIINIAPGIVSLKRIGARSSSSRLATCVCATGYAPQDRSSRKAQIGALSCASRPATFPPAGADGPIKPIYCRLLVKVLLLISLNLPLGVQCL